MLKFVIDDMLGETDPNASKAFKDLKNKTSYLEVDPFFVEGIAKVMNSNKIENGGKYERNNWKNMEDPLLIQDAMFRHVLELFKGNEIDSQSGLSHLYHIGANAMILNWLLTNKKQNKDVSSSN